MYWSYERTHHMSADDIPNLDRALTPQERRLLFKTPARKNTGYAAPPGTGPEGETCKTCKHIYRKRLAGTYIKCDLMRAIWTGGGGTDIKAGSPACARWEAPDSTHIKSAGTT